MDDSLHPQADIELKLQIYRKANYTMQQYGVSLIQELALHNRSAKENVRIEISTTPPFAKKSVHVLERLEEDSTISLPNNNFEWDSEKLFSLTEMQHASLDVAVYQNDQLLTEISQEVEIQTPDTWLGIGILPETLCAFVLPNTAEIAPILQRAAVLLYEWTDNASFDGYQSQSEDRVRRQMAAIYQAIAEQGIVYSMPPADFENCGQRIRLAPKVMEQRLGTCLDMTLLYASCLEAIGLNPLLVLVEGHAFAGAWLVDDMLNDVIIDDASMLRKRCASGMNEMCFVETTAMNAGKAIHFEYANKSSQDCLADDAHFHYGIDVKRCRLAGIRPLPTSSEFHAVKNHFEGTAVDSTPDGISTKQVIPENATPELSKQNVWERKLLDLSLRNNLLNIRRSRSIIPLMSTKLPQLEDELADGKDFLLQACPNEWASKGDDSFVLRAIANSDSIAELIAHDLKLGRLHAFTSEAPSAQAFTKLYRSARLSMEENGVNTLYLALGLLRWYESPRSEKERYAPILLLPVEMKRKRGASGAYSIRSSEEDIMVNVTLLEMLKQDFSLDLSIITQLPRDEHGVDIALIFNTIRDQLKNQARWDIEEVALLGTFSFSKFIMWNDIHNNSAILRSNPLVESLITGQVKWEIAKEEDLKLDHEMRPSELLMPVPADSCQMEAICRAVQGESFVLHGPPGSGKSQTITNIIANALYRGQRVLFVAEKMAALSVVHQRLSRIGLDPFCLELHSNKATKSSVLEQLEEAAQYQMGSRAADFEGESERLYALRHELREHVDALHEKLPLGMSLYETLYAIEILPPAPAAGCYRPAEGHSLSLSYQQWRDNREMCTRLQSLISICGSPASHALRKIDLQSFTLDIKEKAAEQLPQLLQSYQDLLDCAAQIAPLLSLQDLDWNPAQLQHLEQSCSILLSDAHFNSALLLCNQLEDLVTKAKEIVNHGKERDRLMGSLRENFRDSVLQLNGAAMLRDWNEVQSKWFFPRYLGSSRLHQKICTHSKAPQNISKEKCPEYFTLLSSTQDEEKALQKHSVSQKEFFAELQDDWDAILLAATSSQELHQALLKLSGELSHFGNTRTALAENLSTGKKNFLQIHGEKLRAFIQTYHALQEKQKALGELLHLPQPQAGIKIEQEEMQSIQQNIHQLRDWCNWKMSADKARDAGLEDFIQYLEKTEVPAEHVLATYERGIYQDLMQSQMRQHPIFAQFNGLLFEELLKKYRDLATLNQELARLELCARLGAKIPNFAHEASQNSELGILQRNIRSRGRGTSIRQLFDKLPELMPRLKPCMLMSPMSVAQYLDASKEPFDLVIFDEASQMPSCEAVGAIARGKNIIVVGDPRQMPPTSFFSSNSVDEEHLELEDLESILEDCLGISMPSRYLRWHYRSRHESLIAFSNVQYYENKLLTFPSPDDLCSKVSFIPCRGYYDKGKSRCNAGEAEAVVTEVLRHLRDPKRNKFSIGIISFSQVQQVLIEDLLMNALSKAENVELEQLALGGEEPIFIKNLENVQGDERDVIYFSVGYGPDQEGRVSHNFGPLNRQGGERRLNVAVSRARYEMKVFSTLSSEQIELSRTKSIGVAGLRAFLEFAQKGKTALSRQSDTSFAPAPSIIELLAAELESRGYSLRRHVGCSAYRVDIAVIHPDKPEQYLAAIICDGASYQSAPTMRDREITRVGVLGSLGWNILRVWTIDWWMDKEKLISRLCENLEQLKVAAKEEDVQADKPEDEEVNPLLQAELIAGPSQGPAARAYPYERTELPPLSFGSEDPLQYRFAPQIMEQIRSLLQTEAPVDEDYLCRRLMENIELNSLTKRAKNFFDSLFREMKLHYSQVQGKNTYWLSAEQEATFGIYRVDCLREAKHIPVEEFTLAAYDILQQQMAMPREDLQAEIIELFQLGRKTKALRSIVDAGIAHALHLGYFNEEDGRCRIPQ